MTKQNNPWPGPIPYSIDGDYLFCGREDESNELAELISDNVLVTLYGKSGVGKTSIINKGVIPKLDGFECIRLELGASENYAILICQEVAKRINAEEKNNVGEGVEKESGSFLWNQLQKLKTDDPAKQVIIILDQFERVLRGSNTKNTTILLTQLLYMVREVSYFNVEYYCHFVISIREDDLYLLEDCIDENYLFDLKQCRYRLRNLSDKGAIDVVLKPGEKVFDESEIDIIAEKIVDQVKNGLEPKGEIKSMILSLVCSQIYDRYYNGTPLKKADIEAINPETILEDYIDKALECIKGKESFIDKFVDSVGRRVSIPIPTVTNEEKEKFNILSGDHKILQKDKGEDGNYELIHDAFGPIFRKRIDIREAKEAEEKAINDKLKAEKEREIAEVAQKKAEEAENKAKKAEGVAKRTSKFLYLFSFIIVAFSIWLYLQAQDLKINKSKDIAHQAISYINVNFGLANKGAIEAYDCFHTFEAEAALRASYSSSVKGLCDDNNGQITLFNPNPQKNQILTGNINGGYRLWDAESGMCIKSIPDISDCNFAAYSLDGEKFLTVYGLGVHSSSHNKLYNNIYIYDTNKDVPIDTLIGHTEEVVKAFFSGNGKRIVSTGWDGTIRIWDVGGKEIFQLKDGNPHYAKIPLIGGYKITYHPSPVLAISPDGKHILSGYCKEGIDVWNVDDRTQIATLPGSGRIATYSKDGRRVVSADTVGNIYIWDAEHGYVLMSTHKIGYGGSIFDISFNSDGSHIVTATYENSSSDSFVEYPIIRIVETETGNCIDSLKQDQIIVNASFCPDKEQVVFGLNDGNVKIWNYHGSSNKIQTIRNVNSFVFSPDANKFAYATTYTLITGNIVDSRSQKYNVDNIRSISISPSGKRIVLSKKEPNEIHIYEIDSNEPPQIGTLPDNNSPIINAVFDDDETSVIAITDHTTWVNRVNKEAKYKNKIWLWDINTNHYELIDSVDFPIGQFVSKKGLRIMTPQLRIMTPQLRNMTPQLNNKGYPIYLYNDTLLGHRDVVNDIAINSKGDIFVSASDDGNIIIWKKDTKWRIFKRLKDHGCSVKSVSFSPDEKLIVSVDIDGIVKVWSVETGVCISTFRGKAHMSVTAAKFSEDYKEIRVSFGNSGSGEGELVSWEWKPIEVIYEELKNKYKKRVLTQDEKRDLHIED